MGRRKVETKAFEVGHLSVETDHEGRVEISGWQGNQKVVLVTNITKCWGLLSGLRLALKKAREWLDDLEVRVSTPINHKAPGDGT